MGGGVLKNRDRDRPPGDAEMVNYRKIFPVETNLGYVEAKAPGVEAKTAGAVKNDDHLPLSRTRLLPGLVGIRSGVPVSGQAVGVQAPGMRPRRLHVAQRVPAPVVAADAGDPENRPLDGSNPESVGGA